MNIFKVLLGAALGLALIACSSDESATAPAPESAAEVVSSSVAQSDVPDNMLSRETPDGARLVAVLAAQSEEIQARYPWRHPRETLEFFGIAPGMTVVEILPGRGWYSPILVSYLGEDGLLIGADYPVDLWGNFPFANEEFIADRLAWVDTWPEQAEEWRGTDGAEVTATRLGEFSADLAGTVDAVLFIRALHNLNRFEGKGGYRSRSLADAMTLLKPGGVVGVVQHEAPADRDVSWADGSRGYLNRAALIGHFETVGFELVAESDINVNPRDVPGEEDIVWRLPPSLNTSRDDAELRAQYEAIGESNRMTLLFRKPG
jgi:predicted methyltransferase